MAIEKDFFRQVMGRFTTGVTVVTTSNDGVPSGLTVSSFVSLSLDPPLVLVCVDNASHTLQLFRDSKTFAVNFLSSEQVNLSRCFATPSEERFEHFCHIPYHVAATGAPIIDGVLGFVDTQLVAEYPGGDHVIFIGQIQAMGAGGQMVFAHDEGRLHSTLIDYHERREVAATNGNAPSSTSTQALDSTPLVYYRGRYRHLAEEYSEPSLGSKPAASAAESPGRR